jgi:ubiquinone/menaquinone biosynthesis C-methylase UbiE
MLKRAGRLAVLTVLVLAVMEIALVAWHFPYATDDALRREDALQEFYNFSYTEEGNKTVVKDTQRARDAQDAGASNNIRGRIAEFVRAHHLENARVLDVGSGVGYLQDTVEDYTGIDISRSAAAFYHKRFVAGTATAMPFADHEFDAAWSIWVIEHIPNPEAALLEIRRVVKPGGLIYMMPAWDCTPFAAQGYEVRPYEDFGIRGKLVKASIPIRTLPEFWYITAVPNRVIRSAAAAWGPTQLHYRRLIPNYQEYWQADSDAVNDLDRAEMAMWFETRGDSCLNCARGWDRYLENDGPLIIRRGAD